MQGCKLAEGTNPQNSSASRDCFARLAICKGVWLDSRANSLGDGRSATRSA
jgi:hypothetical protein